MKLALGTAQFGMKYGVANKYSDFSLEKISEILQYAIKNNINTLDTAVNYGEAERRLGEIGVNQWNIITKLHSSSKDQKDPKGWVDKQIEFSLHNLRIEKLSGVLVHDVNLLRGRDGKLIWKRLNQLKDQGLLEKVGISIYQPLELELLYDEFNLEIIQAPYNVFDRRIEKSGWLDRIEIEDKELHIRSIFLQGLLLMRSDLRPNKFKPWQQTWERWESWLIENKLEALEACIGMVFTRPGISKIVVGIDSLEQLKEIVASIKKIHSIKTPSYLSCEDEILINPSNWNSL